MNLPQVVQVFMGDNKHYIETIDEMIDKGKAFVGANRTVMQGVGNEFAGMILGLEAKVQEYRRTMGGVEAATNTHLTAASKHWHKLTYEINLAESAAARFIATENKRLNRGSGFERGANAQERALLNSLPGRGPEWQELDKILKQQEREAGRTRREHGYTNPFAFQPDTNIPGAGAAGAQARIQETLRGQNVLNELDKQRQSSLAASRIQESLHGKEVLRQLDEQRQAYKLREEVEQRADNRQARGFGTAQRIQESLHGKEVLRQLDEQRKSYKLREEVEQRSEMRQAKGFGTLQKINKEERERVANARALVYGTPEDRLQRAEQRMARGTGTMQIERRKERLKMAKEAEQIRKDKLKDKERARSLRRRRGARVRGQIRGGVSRTLQSISPFNTSSLPGFIMGVTGATVALHAMHSALQAVERGLHSVVESAMQMERLQITFGVLLGSAEKGKQVFGEIQRLAIITPFTTQQIADTAQTLLGMGVAGDQVIPVLERLGDIAVGDADRLRRLGIIFGQVMAEGRLTGLRMRQFATLGIGMRDFAETMGVSVNTARAQMRSFGIDTDIVAETLNRLTEAGGRFAGLNAANLGTVSGQWNRLVDIVEVSGGKIGMSLFEQFDIAGLLGTISDQVSAAMPKIKDMIIGAFEGLSVIIREVVNIGMAGFQTLGQHISAFAINVKNSGGAMGSIKGIIESATDAMLSFGRVGIGVILELSKLFIKMALSVAKFIGSLERLGIIATAGLGGAIAGATVGAFGGPIGAVGGAIAGATGAAIASSGMPGMSAEHRQQLDDITGMVDAATKSTNDFFIDWQRNLKGVRAEPGGLFPGHTAMPEIRDLLIRSKTALGGGSPIDAVIKAATLEIGIMRLPMERHVEAIDAVTEALHGMAGAAERARIGTLNQISPEAARMQETLDKEMREGTSPMAKFEHDMKLIEQAYNPKQARIDNLKDLETDIGKFNIAGGLGNLINLDMEAEMRQWRERPENQPAMYPGGFDETEFTKQWVRDIAEKSGSALSVNPARLAMGPSKEEIQQAREKHFKDWEKTLAPFSPMPDPRFKETAKDLLKGAGWLGGLGAEFLPKLFMPEQPLSPKQQAEKDFGQYKTYEEMKKGVGFGSGADNLPTTALYGSAEAMKTINQSQTDQTISKLDEVRMVIALGNAQREAQTKAIADTKVAIEELKQQGVVIPGGLK